jgi:hypothetical protein
VYIDANTAAIQLARRQFEPVPRQHELAQARKSDAAQGGRAPADARQGLQRQVELRHSRKDRSARKMTFEATSTGREDDRRLHLRLAMIVATTKPG